MIKLKYISICLILILFLIGLSSCGTSLVLPENPGTSGEESMDLTLRKASSGTYRIACYSTDGKTSYEHVIELVAGDIANGEFIHTEYHYLKDATCETLSYDAVRNSRMNFGAVKGEADRAFSKLLVLPEPYGDGGQVDSPKMNVTTSNVMVTLYDEAFKSDLELEYPDATIEIGVPFVAEAEVVSYYSHAYFPEDYSYVVVAAFIPEFIDYDDRATFETAKNIVAAIKD